MQDTDTVEEVVEAVPDGEATTVTTEVAIPQPGQIVAFRHALERHIIASQELSNVLFGAATDATAALVETPAQVLEAIAGGATLPAALTRAGTDLREIASDAGERVRSSVGDYVGDRAVLPNAVIGGVAEIAGSVVRAQGTIVSSAVDAALTVASTAAQGGDVRGAFGTEVRELTDTARTVRDTVGQTVSAARQGVRDAVTLDDAE